MEPMSEISEPSAICLKAAYRLLAKMNASPEPPSLDRLASMIEESLRYSEAIALIDEAECYFRGESNLGDTANVFETFVQWARS